MLQMSENAEITKFSRKAGVLKYDRNPFWSTTKIRTRGRRVTVERGTYISEDGETQDFAGIHTVHRTDLEKFVKVYTGHLKAVLGLKPSSLKVLVYLLHVVQESPNTDCIFLAWAKAQRYFKEQEIKIGRTSYQAALLQLINSQIIAESTVPYHFWLNPQFYWNGDRYTFWQTHIMES